MPIWLLTLLVKVVLPLAITTAEKLGWDHKLEGWAAKKAGLVDLAVVKLENKAADLKTYQEYPSQVKSGLPAPDDMPAHISNINYQPPQ